MCIYVYVLRLKYKVFRKSKTFHGDVLYASTLGNVIYILILYYRSITIHYVFLIQFY